MLFRSVFRRAIEGRDYDQVTNIRSEITRRYHGPGIDRAVWAAWEQWGYKKGLAGHFDYKKMNRYGSAHDLDPDAEAELVAALSGTIDPLEVKEIMGRGWLIGKGFSKGDYICFLPCPLLCGKIASSADPKEIAKLLNYSGCSWRKAPKAEIETRHQQSA